MSDHTLITIGFSLPIILLILLLIPTPQKENTFIYITQRTGETIKCQLIDGKMENCNQIINAIWE